MCVCGAHVYYNIALCIRHCLRYVYGPLIEKMNLEIDGMLTLYIRPNRLVGCPSGDDMYNLP